MTRWLFVVLPLTVALTAVITWFASLYAFERPVFDESVEQKTISSASLGEQREYLVHLPESYGREPNQRYPVIYVLDGSSQDMHTAASAALMARIGVTPEVIVVGIPNIDGKGRQRDYTPPGMRQDMIDKAVVAYMREHGYDLTDYARRNWPTLGPKLAGRLTFISAEADDFYLSVSVYGFESAGLVREMAELMKRTATADADTAQWTY
jgi:hypothetical protein